MQNCKEDHDTVDIFNVTLNHIITTMFDSKVFLRILVLRLLPSRLAMAPKFDGSSAKRQKVGVEVDHTVPLAP